MSTSTIEGFSYKGEKLHLDFYPNFLEPKEAQLLFTHLETNVSWSRNPKGNYRVNQNYGDPGITYQLQFGEKIIIRQMLPWDHCPILRDIKERLSLITDCEYNYCVLMRYPNGRVGIEPHRDKEMAPGTNIAGISLGAQRTLTMIPPKYISSTQPFQLSLTPGSLYVLRAPTNEYWQHSIDKEPLITEPRISLTFRFMKD